MPLIDFISAMYLFGGFENKTKKLPFSRQLSYYN
jgi:hypothetical protein